MTENVATQSAVCGDQNTPGYNNSCSSSRTPLDVSIIASEGAEVNSYVTKTPRYSSAILSTKDTCPENVYSEWQDMGKHEGIQHKHAILI